MKNIKFPIIAVMCFLLAACSSGKIVKKPTPLSEIKAEVTIKKNWSADIGSGTWDRYLRLTPAQYGDALYAADKNGVVKAINAKNGKVIWRKNYRLPLSSDIGVSKKHLMLGSSNGDLIVLDRLTGDKLWSAVLSNEIISKPIYYRNKIIVKTVDSKVTSFHAKTGKIAWEHSEKSPELNQRVGSAPIAKSDRVFLGFANGNMLALTTDEGKLSWKKLLTSNKNFELDSLMVDIDVDPKLYSNNLYVAGMNSNLVSIDTTNYSINWQKQISTYSGLDVDRASVVVTDNDGIVYLYRRSGGRLVWRQEALKNRDLTGPVIYKGLIFVADIDGYLHVLSVASGKLVGRVYTHETGIVAAPIVQNDQVVVKTNNGYLKAYTF